MKPITVAIGTYRDLNAFREAINSVYRWTETPFELILICNGPTNEFRRKFSEYAMRLQEYHKNIKHIIINNGNPGNSTHRNVAIKLSNKFVAFLDDDAKILGYGPDGKDWLQTMYDVLILNDRLAGVGALEYLKIYTRNPSVYTKASKEPMKFNNLVEFCSLWRRSALEDIGYKDPYFRYPADEPDMNYRLKLKGWEVRAIPGINIFHPVTDLSKANVKAIQEDANKFEKKWGVKFHINPKSGLPSM